MYVCVTERMEGEVRGFQEEGGPLRAEEPGGLLLGSGRRHTARKGSRTHTHLCAE